MLSTPDAGVGHLAAHGLERRPDGVERSCGSLIWAATDSGVYAAWYMYNGIATSLLPVMPSA